MSIDNSILLLLLKNGFGQVVLEYKNGNLPEVENLINKHELSIKHTFENKVIETSLFKSDVFIDKIIYLGGI